MTEQPGSAGGVSAREAALAETFVELAGSLVQDYDVIEVLDRLVHRCVEVLQVSAAGMLLDDQAGGLAVAAASSEDMRILEVFQAQSHSGPCWDCGRSGRPVHSEDLRSDGRWPGFARVAAQVGFVSMSALPLRLQGQNLGVLGLFGDHADAIRPEDARLAQGFADVAAIGLLHQRSEHRHAVMVEQLRRALDSRVTIEQAKGVLAERGRLSMEQAFARLRQHARNNNLKLTAVAQDVVEGRLDLSS